MFRHFRWLQAIENGSNSKTTLPDRTSQMPRSAGMRESGVRMGREKAMDGFFNNVLALEDQVALVHQVVEPLIENNIAVPPGIEFRPVHSHQAPESCMSTLAGKLH